MTRGHSDGGEVISSSRIRHTLGVSPAGGKTQASDKLAHPATLTILGLKVSTCFRRAFMVFPVSTMALGKGRAKGEMKREWQGASEGRVE